MGLQTYLADFASMIVPILLGLQFYDLQQIKKKTTSNGEDIARIKEHLKIKEDENTGD